MIKEVRFSSPLEWMYRNEKPEFPLCCFRLETGTLEAGYTLYDFRIWFLDLSGREGQFDDDVISDQLETAKDIWSLLKQSQVREWLAENANFTLLTEKFEDYISGVELSLQIKVFNQYDTCDIPVNS